MRTPKPVPAAYKPPTNPLYKGNPLIEAMEPLTKQDVMERLSFHPPYDPRDRAASVETRNEMLDNLRYFFQALPRHLALSNHIQSMIRTGYAARCPEWGNELMPDLIQPLVSGALMGLSGLGKTVSVERVLRLQPQVILHTEYRGQELFTDKVLGKKQVVWLRVECPHNGSSRSLCMSVLEGLDRALGTNYSEKFGGSRSTTTSMIPEMDRLIRLHYVGLLVIDEFQNLSMGRGIQGTNELFSFLVRIINELSVPVLMIGTASSVTPGEEFEVVDQAFRVRRRATGLTDPVWSALRHGSDEWEIFSSQLWTYQYLRKECPLTPAMDLAFYELCQGIPDLAVKLYQQAQLIAISEGEEELTPEFLATVARQVLVASRKPVESLRLAAGSAAIRGRQGELPWVTTGAPMAPAKAGGKKQKNAKVSVPGPAPLLTKIGDAEEAD